VRVPVEPPPTPWVFPSVLDAEPEGPVALGGDLEPGTLLAAYRAGLFPMPIGRRGRLGWFSPDPRGVLFPGGMRVSGSLRRSLRRFEIRIDTAFDEVIKGCADPGRPHGWIDPAIIEAYTALHQLGWAHSVEAWRDGQLAGGLYGVRIGAFFAGESMFHRRTDASKVALAALARMLEPVGGSLIDVQWSTPHLASLGVVELERSRYLTLASTAMQTAAPDGFRTDAPNGPLTFG
jgi:leucyl/phenylalanyl-tRNA---protein transferase